MAAPAAGAAHGAHPAAQTRVYLDGDSLAYGTGLFLGRYLRGWTITQAVSISRHAYEGAGAIRSQAASLPPVVVLNLGTNDDPGAVSRFAAYVREVVRAAGPRRCVIWANVVRPPYAGVSYDGYNAVLARAAQRSTSFHVFDWVALARAHPGWFGPDGVHPSIAGYRVRAAALARLIRSCYEAR